MKAVSRCIACLSPIYDGEPIAEVVYADRVGIIHQVCWREDEMEVA